MNRSTAVTSFRVLRSSCDTACSSSPFFLPTAPPLSPSTPLTDDPDRSIRLEHVFYCQEADSVYFVLDPVGSTTARSAGRISSPNAPPVEV